MEKKYKISEAEVEVMKILWKHGESTSSEIVSYLSSTTEWKPKTIQTLITRLVAKGAIESKKLNNRAYKYMPCISEEEYINEANESFIKKIYNGSIKMMLTSFIKDNKISAQDLEELKNMLDKGGD